MCCHLQLNTPAHTLASSERCHWPEKFHTSAFSDQITFQWMKHKTQHRDLLLGVQLNRYSIRLLVNILHQVSLDRVWTLGSMLKCWTSRMSMQLIYCTVLPCGTLPHIFGMEACIFLLMHITGSTQQWSMDSALL